MKPSYTIRDVTLADCDEIASLLRDNFLKFSPYADFLSETEKQGYITLNTAERLRTKCKQKEYEMHKVMIDESGKIIGYRAAKKESLTFDGGKYLVLAGKRLHCNRKYANSGLYEDRIQETFDFVKNYNKIEQTPISAITGVPSNNFVTELYNKTGFMSIDTHTTDSLQAAGIKKSVPLMIYMIE